MDHPEVRRNRLQSIIKLQHFDTRKMEYFSPVVSIQTTKLLKLNFQTSTLKTEL